MSKAGEKGQAQAVTRPEARRLEPIAPIETTVRPNALDAKPQLRWIPVAQMRVNRNYQRNMSEGSRRLIRLLVENWSWARVKALNVFGADGAETVEVFDGQHTAIAAATRGDIPELPCLVSASREQAEAARDFVALNTNRLSLTATQLFQARLAAGDEEAEQVQACVERGGGRILRNPTPSAWCRPGDTVALGVLAQLVRGGNAALIERIIALAVKADLAPVPSAFIKGAAQLLAGDPKWRTDEAAIIRAVRAAGIRKLTAKSRELRDKFPLTSAEAMARAVREAVVLKRVEAA